MPPGFRPAQQVMLGRSVAPQPADLRGAAVVVPRATSPRCCATSRSSASSCRAATGRRWPRSSRSWRWTRASRQLTMDRSLSSLPPALQSLTLYEVQGELVDGNRGILDFADLLKRPLEAFKYLLGTVEQGRVTLDDRGAGGGHGVHRLVQRGLPGGVQGAARVPVVQGADRAGARALPAGLPAGAEDLRGAHPVVHLGRRAEARGPARRLGDGAVGGAHPHEEADAREVPQGAGRAGVAPGPDGEGAAVRGRGARRGVLAGADQGAARRASSASPASPTPTRTTRGAPGPRRAR